MPKLIVQTPYAMNVNILIFISTSHSYRIHCCIFSIIPYPIRFHMTVPEVKYQHSCPKIQMYITKWSNDSHVISRNRLSVPCIYNYCCGSPSIISQCTNMCANGVIIIRILVALEVLLNEDRRCVS